MHALFPEMNHHFNMISIFNLIFFVKNIWYERKNTKHDNNLEWLLKWTWLSVEYKEKFIVPTQPYIPIKDVSELDSWCVAL